MMMKSRAVCVLFLVLLHLIPKAASEYSTKTDPEYEFADYRGKWCVDDHGFVYGIGEVYHPGPSACPCACTEDGPVCARPTCPRVHPRCTRIKYKHCCPVCEAISKVCVYGDKTYRILEEFKLSSCERCRCEPNGEVYCSIWDCPAPHCVNPTYEPNHCCPLCKTGPNCFAGNRVISALERVEIDEQTVCYCTYRDGTWQTHPQATCEQRSLPDPALRPVPSPPGEDDTKQMDRDFSPRLDWIP
ncbi:hypothetical protein DPEC_G00279990 [Dallia pectoralis]|uniref:Uncharacterized protein n=1 Tax=Dallia pectoralis TaxID=75939 RepID=A0ACC2FMI6_DALPE|nr:hypothetical protein DPEC_G00279990 [Dallia pectoralis]